MKLLNKRLLSIAAMTILSGSAFAKPVDQDINSRTFSRDVPDSYAFFRDSSQSFTDIIDLGIGVDKRTPTVVTRTASRASDESPAQSAGIYDLLLALSDEPEVTEAALSADSSPDDTVIDLPALLIPEAHAARVPGTSDRQAGDGVLFSVATIPQPGDWMTLLCGFVVVAFIARRKTSAFAN